MINFIKHLIKSILLTPLNMVMLLIIIPHILLDLLIKRYKKCKNDLLSFPRISIRRIKLLIKKYKKKRKEIKSK